jgi:hypothetical protein
MAGPVSPDLGRDPSLRHCVVTRSAAVQQSVHPQYSIVHYACLSVRNASPIMTFSDGGSRHFAATYRDATDDRQKRRQCGEGGKDAWHD